MTPALSMTSTTFRAAIPRGALLLVVAALVMFWDATSAQASPAVLTKTATDLNGGVLEPGDLLEYRIAATNPTAGAVPGLVVQDPVPAGSSYVAGSLTVDGTPQTDAVGDDSAGIVGGVPTFTLGTLPTGTVDRVMTFRVRVDVTAPHGSVIRNQATGTPGPVTSNAVTTTVTVFPPVIGVTAAVADLNGGPVQPGDTLRYTVATRNTGTGPAAEAVTTASVPMGTEYVPGSLTVDGAPATDPSGDDAAEAAAELTFRVGTGADAVSGGTLAPGGGQAVVTFDVRVKDDVIDGSVIALSAASRYRFVFGGAVQTAASPSVHTSVTAPPAVTVDASVTGGTGGAVGPGDVLTYRFEVSSTGAGAARDVAAGIAVPAGTVYVPGSTSLDGVPVTDDAGDDTGQSAGGRVTVHLGAGASSAQGGRMAPGTTSVVRFRVVVGAVSHGTVIAARADATFGGFADGVDRTASSPILRITVSDPPRTADIVVTESFRMVFDADGDGRMGPGDFVQYRVTVANRGDAAATGLAFDQQIPSVVAFIDHSLFITRGTARFRAPSAIAVTIPTLAPHTTASLAYVVRLRPTATSTAQLVTRTTATSGMAGPPPRPTARPARLRITLRGPRRVLAGHHAVYRIHIANLSRRTVNGLTLQQAIPRGFAISGSAPRLTFVRSSPRWRISAIRPGSAVTLVVRLHASRSSRGTRIDQIRLTGPTIIPVTLRMPLTVLPAAGRIPRVVG